MLWGEKWKGRQLLGVRGCRPFYFPLFLPHNIWIPLFPAWGKMLWAFSVKEAGYKRSVGRKWETNMQQIVLCCRSYIPVLGSCRLRSCGHWVPLACWPQSSPAPPLTPDPTHCTPPQLQGTLHHNHSSYIRWEMCWYLLVKIFWCFNGFV